MAEPSASISLQFFEGAAWTAGRNLLQVVLSVVALAIVARELGPENYGVYGIAMLVIMVAEMLAGMSLTEAIVQRKELNDGHIDATFWLSLAASVSIGALIVVFAELFAGLAGSTQAADVLTVLACLLPIRVGSAVPMALLERHLRFRVKSQVGALATILSCGSGIVLALSGAGIWTLVIMEAVSSMVNLVGSFLAVRWRPGRRGRWRHLCETASFNTNTLVAYAVGYADMLVPRILVSHLLGVQTLGVLMLADRVYTELFRLLTAPLASVAMAACARAQDVRDELHRVILGLYRTSRLILFPACLGVVALAPYLIPWLFGPRWAAAVPATQILILGGLRLATGAFNTAILFGVGRVQSSLLLFAMGLLLHVVLIPALAPWGIVGVSIALLLRDFGDWPLACLLIKRATGLSVRRQIKGGMPVLFAATAMAILVWWIAPLLEPWLPLPGVLVVGALTGAIGYVAALRVVAPATLRTATALVAAFVRRDRVRLETVLAQTS